MFSHFSKLIYLNIKFIKKQTFGIKALLLNTILNIVVSILPENNYSATMMLRYTWWEYFTMKQTILREMK